MVRRSPLGEEGFMISALRKAAKCAVTDRCPVPAWITVYAIEKGTQRRIEAVTSCRRHTTAAINTYIDEDNIIIRVEGV